MTSDEPKSHQDPDRASGSTSRDGSDEIAEALRISEHRLRMAISVSPMTVFNQDLELRYTWLLNPKPGPYGGDVRGKTDRDILERPEDAETLEAIKRRVLETGRGLRREVEVMMDGELRRFDLTLEPLRGETGIIGLTGAALDVTEQSHMEEALRSQAEALAEADRRKDEFIAMLGHELRSPLAPIRNALESLSHRRQAEDRPIQREIEVIGRQLDHLTRLVDDLLDVARITRGRVELRRQPVALRSIVATALETVEPTTRERNQRIEATLPDEPVTVDGDPVRLAQVLANLLSNASKYSEASSTIELEASLEGDPAERVVLEVRDQGIGMPVESLHHVFDRFFQMDDSLDRTRGGLGLGLTLVKALTEMHGGTVGARSDGPGQGSAFNVRLPLSDAAPEAVTAGPDACAPDARTAPGGSPDGVRVVVVDDSVDTAQSFAELLELKGHDVRAAHDGPSAIELCRRFRPDVVFLDIGLPGMTGYQVAERLRAAAGGDEAPLLIAVTGYGQAASRHRSSEAGFDRHLLKPVDLKEVLDLLDEAAKR
jgi:signal transduction histidine kinase